MPHFNLRYFMQTLHAQRGRDAFVLQIGAMDGVTSDPVYEYIHKFQWAALLVEPIKEHFDTLQENYHELPNVGFANVAIGETNGPATMHRLPTHHVLNKEVPRWGLGVASLYTDRNALAFDEVRPFVIQETVACVTLPTLLARHAVTRMDVIQIDAEGHDYHILKQLDFARYHPLIVHLEIVNLPKSEQTACKALLDSHGYLHVKAGYNLLAISPRLILDSALNPDVDMSHKHT